MKIWFKSLLIIFVWVFVQSSYAQNLKEKNKLRVGVIEFNEKNNVGTDKAGLVVAMLLNNHFKSIDLWQLQDRITLNQVLNEQSLQQVSLSNDSAAMELGKIEGVQAIITGSVMRIGKNRIITARLVDVTTAQVKQSASVRFNAPEDLEGAVERLAYLVSGYTPREYYTMSTRKALKVNRLGASLGTGWGQTRIEHRYNELNEFGEKVTKYTKKVETDFQGAALDFNFQSLYLDAEAGGIIPNHVGLMRGQMSIYPFTHVGVAGAYLKQSNTTTSDGNEYGSMTWSTYMLGLSFRASPQFRFGLYKGKTTEGTVRYHTPTENFTAMNIRDDFDFLSGPTMAQVDYLWAERYSIRALYFHDLETSPVFTLADSQGNLLEHKVTGLVRLFSVQFGVNFAL